jgi:glycosyltransferase involved in cell wall biosynthesis
MKSTLVSIIIPIYNAEKYLSECIYSCLCQSYENLQIVLVNDGSLDNSEKICKEFEDRDNRILYIRQDNAGANKARELGVKNAKGEWIFFVDADDVIEKNALQILIDNSKEKEIIVANIEDGIGCVPINTIISSITSENYIKLLLKRKILLGPMAKLCKKTLFTPFTFDIPDSIKIGEDMVMNIRLALEAKSVKLLPDVIYKYNRTTGVTAKKSWNIKDFLLVHKTIKESFSLNLQKKYSYDLFLCFLYNFIWMIKDNLRIRTRIRALFS